MTQLNNILRSLMYLTITMIVGYFLWLSIQWQRNYEIGGASKIDSLVKINKNLMDSIDIQYKKIIFTEDSLKTHKDSLSKSKKQVYVKKINNLRYISLDSNIVILSKFLSQEDTVW